VNCAGPWAGEIARMAGIGGEDDGGYNIPLPVEPRLHALMAFFYGDIKFTYSHPKWHVDLAHYCFIAFIICSFP